MATNIKLKSSALAGKTPTLSDLSLRELAVNTADGKLFLRKGDGSGTDTIIDFTDHGTLNGLADDDHLQYLHISNNRTGVTANINTSGTLTISNTSNTALTVAGNVGIGTTNPTVKLDVNGSSRIDAELTIGTELRFLESAANGSNYVGFKAPTSLAADKIWTLPSADGTNGQVLTTNGSGVLSWSTASGGAGVSDGDKGDITVSSSGATWTIDNTAVTYAKIQNVTTSKILGRSTAGSGSVEEISIGSGLSLSGGTLSAIGGGSGISSSRAIALTLVFA